MTSFSDDCRSYIQELPEALFLEDMEGNILDVNEQACKVLGYERKELIGMEVEEITPDGVPAFLPGSVDEATRTGEPLEAVNVRKDGKEIPVELRGKLIEVDGEQRVLISLRNITERKKAEKKHEIVTEGSSQAIYLFQDGGFKFVNKSFEQLTGYTEEELSDMNFLQLAHPDYRNRIAEWTRQALTENSSGLPERIEYEALTKEGETIWVRTMPSLIEYEGNPAIVGNVVDIEAKESAEKYKALFQYAYDAILLSHFETGRIFEANPEAENLLGYQTEELLEKNLSSLFPDEDFSQLKEHLEDGRFFYRGGQPVQKKDGSRIVTTMSSYLMVFRGKKTILSLLQDMTQRIELEEKLRNRAQSLKASNEKLEEIIHIISHDLKEPLRSIGTYSDMIFSKYHEDMTDTSFQRLKDIKEDATRLKKMLDEVSNLTQVTSNVSSEPLRVPELIDEIKSEIGLDPDEVEILVDSNFPKVKFDRFQLKVLLKNLITNGIKYNEDPKQVEIGYDPEPEESKLVVYVRDNGEGIDEEHQERVFRMFEQLEPGKRSKGTGAGLAICKRIIEGINEEIWLDSEPGVGTTVGFTVPIF